MLIKQELKYKSGDRVSLKELKANLQYLYDKYQIKETAKATHITRYGYWVRRCKIRLGKKRIDGYELYTVN